VSIIHIQVMTSCLSTELSVWLAEEISNDPCKTGEETKHWMWAKFLIHIFTEQDTKGLLFQAETLHSKVEPSFIFLVWFPKGKATLLGDTWCLGILPRLLPICKM